MIFRSIRPLVAGVAALMLLAAAPASAAALTIGDFFYDTDPFFGPVFSVSNFSDTTLGDSGGTFTDLTINLLDDQAIVFTYDLGSLGAGESIDTLLQDLSIFSFDEATLVASFSIDGVVSVDPIPAIVFEGTFPNFTGSDHVDSFISLTATGEVLPRSAPPGDQARAVGRVLLKHAGPLASGAVVQARVAERST